MNIAFLGLGVMGFPMAGHLSKAGHTMYVYNRTKNKAEQWLEQYDGHLIDNLQEAIKNVDFVITCLKDDNSLIELFLGTNGVLPHMKEGSMIIDHTTASASFARELGEIATKYKVSFLDAPVSGGQSGAQQGKLAIMVGGNETDFMLAKPILKPYTKQIQFMGANGSGQLTKMVNQICIAGLVQALAEGVNFAKKAGLDLDKAMSVIGDGAAGSWQQQNRYKNMENGEFNFGFAVDLMRKDLNLAMQEAKNIGASLPITALVDQFYADIQRLGGGRFDTCSLITRLN